MVMILPLKDENPHPPGFKPKVTYALIVVNVIVFFYEVLYTGQFLNFGGPRASQLFLEWGAIPACVVGAHSIMISGTQIMCPSVPYISLFSSMFMHGSLMHLGGNMLFLWIFGDNIEAKFGKAKFLAIYLIWGLVASFAHIAFDSSSPIPAIGASGAISGVMGAYLIIFPRARVLTLLWIVFIIRMLHIPSKYILSYYLIVQNLLPVLNSRIIWNRWRNSLP